MDDSVRSSALLKVKEAAQRLGMSASSLYRLCKSGRVPAYAAGSKGYGVRVDIEEAKAALRRQVQTRAEQNKVVK